MPLVFNNSLIDKKETERTSFSGADIRAVIHRPNFITSGAPPTANNYPNSESITHELGAIQTISISSFRDKREVRSLGFQGARGYTRGNRTIGGSLIFAFLDTHPFNDTGADWRRRGTSGVLRSSSGGLLVDDNISPDPDVVNVLRRHQYDFTWDSQYFGELMHPDEMPPFDVVITFANEPGSVGKMILHGVDIMSQGIVLSIEDIFTEMTYQFTALGISEYQEGTFLGRGWTPQATGDQEDFALQTLTSPSRNSAGGPIGR